MLRATLVAMGNNRYSGAVAGHPCADTVVCVTRLSHDSSKVTLYCQTTQVGEGLLTLRDGIWRGRCSENAGEWQLEAQQGSSTLWFHEHAPAEAGAA